MYNWKNFWMPFTGGMLAFVLVITTIFFSGMVFAIPLTGIGGFKIKADEIRMTNFKMLPKIGETSEKQIVPQVTVSLDAEIKNMSLIKEMTVPILGNTKIIIKASDKVKAKNLILNLTSLKSDTNFKNLIVSEKYNQDPTKKIYLSSPDAVLKNAEITAHYLFANTISIPGMSLVLE